MLEPHLQKKPFSPARIGAIIALSSVLGLTFNASNPLGVRFGAQEKGHRSEQGEKSAESASSFVATNVSQRPIQTPPVTRVLAQGPTVQNPIPQPGIFPQPATAPIPATPGTAPLAPPPPSFKAPSPIAWAQVKPILLDRRLVLVDARAKPMFDAGHIPGAVSLPEISPPEDIASFQKQHGASAHVVVYCSSTSCSLSFKLANKLAKDYGFTNVQFMTGGYMEWQRENALEADSASSITAFQPPASFPLPAAPPVQTTPIPGPNISSRPFQLPPPFPIALSGSEATPRNSPQPSPKPQP